GSGRTTMVWRPAICFSPAGVSWAITRPWSMTEIASASASASSRYWVVSSTVDPSATSERIMPQTSSRLAGSRPVVGSSRTTCCAPLGCLQAAGGVGEDHDQAVPAKGGGQVEPPPNAAGVGPGWPVGGLGQLEAGQQFGRAGFGLSPAQVQQGPDEQQVLGAGEAFVDRRVLPGEPDQAAYPGRVADHVVPAHLRPAGVGPQQCRQYPHCGGLAGSVGAQHAEYRARPGGQIH